MIALPQQKLLTQVAVNIPESIYHQETMVADVTAMWGGAEKFAAMPLEEPVVQTEQTDPTTWDQYKFARDWAKPLGLID